MAEPGAVAWQFERKGVAARRRRRSTRTSSCWPPSTPAPRTSSTRATPGGSPPPRTDLHAVRTALEEAGITVESADLTMVAQNLGRRSTTPSSAKKVLDLIDALEDLDDVQDVYANFDIPDDVLAQLD